MVRGHHVSYRSAAEREKVPSVGLTIGAVQDPSGGVGERSKWPVSFLPLTERSASRRAYLARPRTGLRPGASARLSMSDSQRWW